MPFVLTYTTPQGVTLSLAPVTSIPAAGRQARRLLMGEGRQFLTWASVDRYVDLLVTNTVRGAGTAEITTHTRWTLRINRI